MVDFDFSSLTAEKTVLPSRTNGREGIAHNPFVPWVQESYDTNTGRAVTVPKEHVTKTTGLIRRAAAQLGLGVRIVTSPDKEALEKLAKNKPVKVMFQGKTKKKYAPRTQAQPTTQESDSTVK